MKDVNEYIKRTQHHSYPTFGLWTRLNGARYFSHLDMNASYIKLELVEESRKLTAIYMYLELKHFKRLCFGVNSAAEIFK